MYCTVCDRDAPDAGEDAAEPRADDDDLDGPVLVDREVPQREASIVLRGVLSLGAGWYARESAAGHGGRK